MNKRTPTFVTSATRAQPAWTIAAWMLGLVMVWFGAMKWFAFEQQAIAGWLQGHVWLGAGVAAHAAAISIGIGLFEIAAGLLVLPPMPPRWRARAALALAIFWGVSLSLLLSNPVWITDAPYSGFPVIGSGQGILKNLGIAALALGIYGQVRGRRVPQRWGLWGIWAGQLLVLVWIGLMKFTLVEAQGVEGIMRPSPLFNWLYRYFDVQGAAIAIGVIELVTAALIACWPWKPGIGRLGLWLVAATYVLTNTFLFTTPGWQDGYGFPFVGGTGQFLLKDLLLLAGAVVLLGSRAPAAGDGLRNDGSAHAGDRMR